MAKQAASGRGRVVVVKSLNELNEWQLAGAHTFEVLKRPGGTVWRVWLSSEKKSRRIMAAIEALRAAGVLEALRAGGVRFGSVGGGEGDKR